MSKEAVELLKAELTKKLAEVEAICAEYQYEVTPTLLLRHMKGPSFSMLLGNDDLSKVVLCIAEMGDVGEVVEEPKAGMNLTLKWEGGAGDGKCAYVVADQNDGWQDLRIEVDTDDCDSDFARQAMQTVIDRVNAANEKA
jgi:hypothetical protein